MVIGLSKDAVRVVPYQPEWKTLFREEAKLLRPILESEAFCVEHIGSTSIVGMEAKPIIDLMVAVPNLKEARVFISKLETLGYEFLSDEPPPDRLFFAKGPRTGRTHHLSLTESSSVFFANMISFRDYLKSHPQTAKEYRALKKHLAAKYPDKRPLYTEGKRAFVEGVLDMAKTLT